MPINLNLELTDHCNIKCKMCSQSMRDEAHGVPMQFMSWDTWQKSLHNLSSFEDDIHLCPHWLGEPTLHPHFDQFVEYAFALNIHNRLFREFKLHTNAVLFSEKRAQLLLTLANLPYLANNTFRFIHFSIDAFSKPVYEIVKGVDRRQQVYNNINRFIEIRHRLGLERPAVTLAFVVQPDNAHEVVEFRDYWAAVLKRYNRPMRQTYDWPAEEMDTIYFRRLNTDDQDASDKLHEQAVHELGIDITRPLRGDESF